MARAKLVGINHVALEVGDVDEAIAFYGRFFEQDAGPLLLPALIGDQVLALSEGRTQGVDAHRHFGLVVDDKEAVRAALEEAGVELSRGRSLDFRDPWGNQIEVVGYRDIQFTKAPWVLAGMGLNLEKSERAREELRAKGLDQI